MNTAHPVLAVRGAIQTFGPVIALSNGHIELRAGEIHALVGENGAGKSTLVKIMAGLYRPSGGVLELDGSPVNFASVAESKAAGISVIYQEPTLFSDLSVAENLFIGRQPRNRLGLIDHRRMASEAAELFAQLGVSIDPARQAEGLSIADQQLIEIAKAIALKARVLIMDEPTAALSGNEVHQLFTVARRLRDQGAALLFISHRMDEVFELCDRVTVMRDGAHVATHPLAEVDEAQLVSEMVGRSIEELFPKTAAELGQTILTVTGLTREPAFRDVSFTVRSGEIVGIAGLVGAGRSEVARCIFGIDRASSGTVSLAGRELRNGDPADAIRAGIAFVPEDRRKQGLVMPLGVQDNLVLPSRSKVTRLGFMDPKRERALSTDWVARLQVKTASLGQAVSTLSGGNQQKVVLGKWLATSPRLLIIDEPTRGIDVGTKSEVHRLLSQLAGEGMAILMISSELPEVLGMADRILVMCEGRLTAGFTRAQASPEAVMQAATTRVRTP